MEILAEPAPKLKVKRKCLWCKVKNQRRTAHAFTGFCKQEHEKLYIKNALDKYMREASVATSGIMAIEAKEKTIALRKARRAFLKAHKGRPFEQVIR